MNEFNDFLKSIDNASHKEKMEAIFMWISETFPNLETTVKWNQPMYTDHGTFIIAFSKSKAHFSVAPEPKALAEFTQKVKDASYSQTTNLFRIKWDQDIDYVLLKEIIQYNIDDKADCATFWRT